MEQSITGKICMDDLMPEYNYNCDEIIRSLWNDLKCKTGYSNMTDKFIYVLKHFSTNKNLEYPITTDEWVQSEYRTVDDDKSEFCICSHVIHELYFIRSKLNGNTLRVGNTCVYQSFDNKNELCIQLKASENRRRYKKSGSGINRICLSCGKHKINVDDPVWKTVCKSCYKSGKKGVQNVIFNDGKTCDTCNRRVIPKDDWRKTCYNCYKLKQNHV
jgi:hypothetical protein